MWTKKDYEFMQQALCLARKGLGRTWPNPMVGAVVVKAGRVIGSGWHHRTGEAHAEVLALRQAGLAARGATLYVTLEPCSHQGKTPPCAPRVLQSGVTRVVVAMQDPNPKVSGRGLTLLRRAGVQVEVGLLRDESRQLNEVFIKRITTGLPFVLSKAALSLDGKIASATGSSQWITGLPARRYAHQLRAMTDAVIVGSGTLNTDDPLLTVRLSKPMRKDRPWRIILEGDRPVNLQSKLFKNEEVPRVILATAQTKHEGPYPKHVEVWHLPSKGNKKKVDIGKLLARLGERECSLVMVEGGAETHASFFGLDQPRGKNWVDRVHFIYAPKLIGGRRAPSVIGGVGVQHPDVALHLEKISWETLGSDILLKATPVKPMHLRKTTK